MATNPGSQPGSEDTLLRALTDGAPCGGDGACGEVEENFMEAMTQSVDR